MGKNKKKSKNTTNQKKEPKTTDQRTQEGSSEVDVNSPAEETDDVEEAQNEDISSSTKSKTFGHSEDEASKDYVRNNVQNRNTKSNDSVKVGAQHNHDSWRKSDQEKKSDAAGASGSADYHSQKAQNENTPSSRKPRIYGYMKDEVPRSNRYVHDNVQNKNTRSSDSVKVGARHNRDTWKKSDHETKGDAAEASGSADYHSQKKSRDNQLKISDDWYADRDSWKKPEKMAEETQDDATDASGDVHNFSLSKSFIETRRPYSKSRRSEPGRSDTWSSRDNEKVNQRRSFYNENRNKQNNREDNMREDAAVDIVEDREYLRYTRDYYVTGGSITYEKTREIEADLFSMPKEYSLAHCVAEDMGMGSGIAVLFRREFKRVDELLNQRQKTGGLAVLKDGERFIYYLVTKKHSTGKPAYRSLHSSLFALSRHIKENGVKKLAMPRIGCGLDQLEWDKVKFMIEYIFIEEDIDIVICNLQQTQSSPQIRHKNSKVINVRYPVQDIEQGTIIVYLSSEEGFVSEEMISLDEKFHFLADFRRSRKQLGSVITYEKNANFLLAGCIVKKYNTDATDFPSLQKCVFEIQKLNRTSRFSFVGFQAIRDEDTTINYKIINILRNTLRDVEIYICWVGDMKGHLSAKDLYSTPFNDPSTKKSGRDSSFSRKSNRSGDSWRRDSSKTETEAAKMPRNLLLEWVEDKTNCSKRSANDEASTSQDNAKDWFGKVQKEETHMDGTSHSSKAYKTCENTVPEQEQKPFEPSSGWENWDDEPKGTAVPNSVYERYKLEYESSNICLRNVKEQHNINPRTNFSRACFVSEDMCLQSGMPEGSDIKYFLGDLLNQYRKEGSCAFARDDREYLFCLIIKKVSKAKCDHYTIFSSLQELKGLVETYNVKRLVIPAMAEVHGDSFDWSELPYMLEFLFREGPKTEVILAPFPTVSYIESIKKKNKVNLVNTKHPLFQTKKKSIIIYWDSLDGRPTQDILSLDKRFNHLGVSKRAELQVESVTDYPIDEDYKLYGCVVRKHHTDPFNFYELYNAIKFINDKNQTKKTPLIAASAVEDDDETTNYKIMHILLNCLENVTVHFCWSGSLKEKMPT